MDLHDQRANHSPANGQNATYTHHSIAIYLHTSLYYRAIQTYDQHVRRSEPRRHRPCGPEIREFGSRAVLSHLPSHANDFLHSQDGDISRWRGSSDLRPYLLVELRVSPKTDPAAWDYYWSKRERRLNNKIIIVVSVATAYVVLLLFGGFWRIRRRLKD